MHQPSIPSITLLSVTLHSRWRQGLHKFIGGALLMSAALMTSTVQANDATPQDAQKPTEIRIGLPDQSAGSKPFIRGPLGLAHIQKQLEKEFEPQGIKIQWSFFKGAGPAVNEALANKQLDVVYLGDLAAIIGRAGDCRRGCWWDRAALILIWRRRRNRVFNALKIYAVSGLQSTRERPISCRLSARLKALG